MFFLTLITLHFYQAFDTLNKLLFVANNGVKTEFLGSELISLNDYNKLSGIIKKDDKGTYSVNGGTIYFPQKINFDSITLICKSDYSVIVCDTGSQIEKVTNRKFTVTMSKKGSQWVVSNVTIIN